MAIAAAFLFSGAGYAGETPRRIVSLNLCVDQYLIALADPQQVAGLTRNAVDPAMSAASDAARKFRISGNSAEEILRVRPDLLIGMPVHRTGVMAALGENRFRELNLQEAQNFGEIISQIEVVANAIGQEARGREMVRWMNAELVKIADAGGAGKGRVAAYYQRRGYLTGAGTLVNDMMQRVGLQNLAVRLGRPALSQLSLEELVAARPDFLIVESETSQIADQGTELLQHPILKNIPRIQLRHAWTVCGGPAYVEAVRSLSWQLGKHP